MVLQVAWFFNIERAFAGYYGLIGGAFVVAISSLFTMKNLRWIWRLTHGQM